MVADFSEWVALTHGHGDAMPAQVAAVCAYVAHLAKTRRNSTIPSYVAVVDASNVGLGALRLREQPGGALALSACYVERGAAASGFFGDGALPWDMVAAGAIVGVGILVWDQVLEKKGSSFRAHIMPIAVGMYLPFGLAIPILLGGLIAQGVTRGASTEEEEEKLARRGVLYSSGIIAGEALVGVGLALLASMGIARLDLSLPATALTIITVVAALAFLWDLRRTARKGVDA